MNKPAGTARPTTNCAARSPSGIARLSGPPAADRRIRARSSDRHGARHRRGGGASAPSVQPSAIVRFAHALGYRRLHRDAAGVPLAPRGQRGAELQGAHRRPEARRIDSSAARPARGAGDASRRKRNRSLESLQESRARDATSTRAIAILARRATIYRARPRRLVSGRRRISTYVLRKLGRRVVLLDGLGGAFGDQAHRGHRRGRAGRDQLQHLQSRHGAAVSRTGRARRAGDFHHRQPAEPDRRGRRRSCSRSRTCRKPALRTLVAPMCLAQALAVGLDLAAD